MKKKAGIFDPWRQAAPPPVDETPMRKSSAEVVLDDNPQQQCVQFAGIRAGIFVWLNAEEDDDGSQRARAVLIDLVYRIGGHESSAKILNSWGVFVGEVKEPNSITLSDGDKRMTITIPVEDPDRLVKRAIDNLALALREAAQQSHPVRDMLVAIRVNPYVK